MAICFYSYSSINFFDGWGNYVGTDPAVRIDCSDGSTAWVDSLTGGVYA